MRHNPGLPFELDEYCERLAHVRSAMASAGVDIALITIPENIYYLTGYTTLGYYMFQVLVVAQDEEPLLLTYREELINIEQQSWVERYRTYDVGMSPVDAAVQALREFNVAGKTISVEERGFFLPIGTYKHLVESVPGASWCDGSFLVEQGRLVKSPTELEYIRRAAVAAMAGMRAALDVAAPGRTENEVAAAVYCATLEHGSEYPGSPPYVISGERSGLPHGTWAGRVLRDGDILFLEHSGCVKRYSSAMMRTAFLGSPPDCVRGRAEAVLDGLEHAIAAIKPGATSGEVDDACRSTIKSYGFGEHTHETGYSIGVCYPPGWNESHIMNLHPGDPTVLQPNMVFHLVPSLIVPELNGHVGFSETVRVTKTGCEVLTDSVVPRDLQVIAGVLA
jgi:Xaa-Pro aminopeptidase